MRIVFIGSTALGGVVLDLLLDLQEVEVVGCLTAPVEFEISYSDEPVRNVLHADIRASCHANQIPVQMTSTGMRDESLLHWARSRKPDIFLVVGWYHMIPRAWREVAPAFGIHASLLPDLAGGAPLVWAIILGRSITGVTLFEMDDGVDSGFIIAQRSFEIAPQDDIASLLHKADASTRDIVSEAIPKLFRSSSPGNQRMVKPAAVMPQRSPADGAIDWGVTAAEVDRFVRAQTRPYPGAFTTVGNSLIRIWRGRALQDSELVTDNSRSGCPGFRCVDGWYVPEDFWIDEREGTVEQLSETLKGSHGRMPSRRSSSSQ